MRPDERTLTPQDIAEGYMRSYHALHGRTPKVQHMSGHWYKVNGEIVHRSTLTNEIIRLRQIKKTQKPDPTQKNVVLRLINKLRAI